MEKIRTGIGYDIHRIKPGCGLFIGGVKVADKLEFVAFSDGDVLIHAIIDSLLGAMGEKDIGEYFPDNQAEYKNICSLELLEKIKHILSAKKVKIINIDSVLILESPEIAPFKEKIKTTVCSCLGIDPDSFNIKAKTKEKIDATGRGEAAECFCTSLIKFN